MYCLDQHAMYMYIGSTIEFLFCLRFRSVQRCLPFLFRPCASFATCAFKQSKHDRFFCFVMKGGKTIPRTIRSRARDYVARLCYGGGAMRGTASVALECKRGNT